jgi:hypothetical protein
MLASAASCRESDPLRRAFLRVQLDALNRLHARAPLGWNALFDWNCTRCYSPQAGNLPMSPLDRRDKVSSRTDVQCWPEGMQSFGVLGRSCKGCVTAHLYMCWADILRAVHPGRPEAKQPKSATSQRAQTNRCSVSIHSQQGGGPQRIAASLCGSRKRLFPFADPAPLATLHRAVLRQSPCPILPETLRSDNPATRVQLREVHARATLLPSQPQRMAARRHSAKWHLGQSWPLEEDSSHAPCTWSRL